VAEAKILGRFELVGQLAVDVAFDLGDLIGDRIVFAAVVFGVLDFPAAFDGAPDELELLVRRQPLRGDGQRRSGRAVLGRDVEAADKAVAGFRDCDFRAKRRGNPRRGSSCQPLRF